MLQNKHYTKLCLILFSGLLNCKHTQFLGNFSATDPILKTTSIFFYSSKKKSNNEIHSPVSTTFHIALKE